MDPHIYSPKVTAVEAYCLTPESSDDIVAWCQGMYVEEIDVFDNVHVGVNVPTIGKTLRASQGDYVVKLGENIFEVLSAKEFHDRYMNKKTKKEEIQND